MRQNAYAMVDILYPSEQMMRRIFTGLRGAYDKYYTHPVRKNEVTAILRKK